MLRHRDRRLILLFVILAIAACTPVPPKVIEIKGAEDYRPSTAGEVKTVEQAIATVLTAAVDSGLPKIDSMSLWLYANAEAFAYWGRGNVEVHEVANIAPFTRANSIHMNLGSAGGTRWDLRLGELARELGHVMHNSLTRNDPKAPGWFREGFAEWVSAKIFASLKWRGKIWPSDGLGESYDITAHSIELFSSMKNIGKLGHLSRADSSQHTLWLLWP